MLVLKGLVWRRPDIANSDGVEIRKDEVTAFFYDPFSGCKDCEVRRGEDRKGEAVRNSNGNKSGG